jgi:hypothetical protein
MRRAALEACFRRTPRPNEEVISLLEDALAAARHGLVIAVTVVTVDPLFKVESDSAGRVEGAGKHLLRSGMFHEAMKLVASEATRA